MSAPLHITVTFNNWRNPNAGAAYKNNAGELDYTLTDRATSEALRAECDILRTEKHADAEAIGALRTDNERLREALRKVEYALEVDDSLIDTAHITGHNKGWNEAIEAAALVVEKEGKLSLIFTDEAIANTYCQYAAMMVRLLKKGETSHDIT